MDAVRRVYDWEGLPTGGFTTERMYVYTKLDEVRVLPIEKAGEFNCLRRNYRYDKMGSIPIIGK